MMIRISWRTLYLLLAIVLLHNPASAATSERTNFLVITVDDLKRVIGVMADRPGNLLRQLYPNPQVRASIKAVLTPNIDKLANSGILFTNAYAVAPVCNPSRIAIATGTRPDLSGFTTNKSVFRDEPGGASLITMQQNLRSHGYFSAGLGKIFHHNKVVLSADGHSIDVDGPDTLYSWDKWINRPIGSAGTLTYSPYSTGTGKIRFGTVDTSLEQQSDYLNAEFIADLLDDGTATTWDSVYQSDVTVNLPTNAPFYLGLGIYLPHQPFAAPHDILALFDPNDMQIDASDLAAIQADLLDLSTGGQYVSGADGQLTTEFQLLLQRGIDRDGAGGELAAWKEVIRHYLAAVAVADRALGVALDALSESSYQSNTIVVLHSDHGFNLGEKNRLDKNDVWDESTGSVLIMNGPDIPAAVIENSVSLQDIYPTVTSLANATLPPYVLGNDLSAYLEDPTTFWSKASFTAQGSSASRNAIRTNTYRYARFSNSPNNAELYHLQNDPDELTNLIDDPPYLQTRIALNTLLNNIRANNTSSPVIVQRDDISTTDAAPTNMMVEAWHANGERVQFTAIDLPTGTTIDAQTGIISGTTAVAGNYYPSITASSASGTARMNFNWTVTGDDNSSRPYWQNGNIETIAVTNNSIRISWSGANDDRGVSNYRIYYQTADQPTKTLTTSHAAAFIAQLEAGTDYLFTVQAIDADGLQSNDGPTLAIGTTTNDTLAPYWSTQDRITANVVSASSLSVSWPEAQDNTAVTAYTLTLNNTPIAIVNDSQYVFDNLLPDSNYSIHISATDAAGNVSNPPLTITLSTTAVLPALHFSTLGAIPIADNSGSADDAHIYTWESHSGATTTINAQAINLPANADINALAVISNDHFFASFNSAVTTLPNIGAVLDEDIVEYNNGTWSVFLSGATMGLRSGGHDIDALSIRDGETFFSIIGSIFVAGVGVVDDADILKWNGSSIEKVWDASDNGLPFGADVVGLSLISEEHFYLSFNATRTLVPGLGAVADADIVEYNNGNWSLYFDGSSIGLTHSGHELDAITIGSNEISPPPDTQAPTWPNPHVTTLSVSPDNIALAWPEAQDNIAVVSYRITFSDGPHIESVVTSATTINLQGLSAQTEYVIDVQALDQAGNVSVDGPSERISTETPPSQELGLQFSTLGSSRIPGLTGATDDADVLQWNGDIFSRSWDASDSGLASSADIDALSSTGDQKFLVSFFASSTRVPGIGIVQDEDIVAYDNGTWSMYFDGTAAGLTASGHDIDAVSVVDGLIYFSTVGAIRLPGLNQVDDADIYTWDGNTFGKALEASEHGLPRSADVDALTVLGSNHFLLSFNSSRTNIDGLGFVEDEDIVEFNQGIWSLYFDGTANSLVTNGHDIDAISIITGSNQVASN